MKRFITSCSIVLCFFYSAKPMLTRHNPNLFIEIGKKNIQNKSDYLTGASDLSPKIILSKLMKLTEKALTPVTNSPNEFSEKKKAKNVTRETFSRCSKMANQFVNLMECLPPDICKIVKQKWGELVEKYIDLDKIETIDTVDKALKYIIKYCKELHDTYKNALDGLVEDDNQIDDNKSDNKSSGSDFISITIEDPSEKGDPLSGGENEDFDENF